MSRHLAIIGASAGVGLECVKAALARGHRVMVLSRSPVPVADAPALTRIRGDATRLDDLRRAVAGVDAVLVCLGVGRTLRSLGPTTLFSDFGAALLRLQDELAQTPVIVLSGFGASGTEVHFGAVARLLFNVFLSRIYKDKTALEEQVMTSRLRWMLVRPGVLTNGPSTHPARVQTEYVPGMRVGTISRRTVAEFMVTQAEQPTLLGQLPALSEK